jgi:hypothetical protein
MTLRSLMFILKSFNVIEVKVEKKMKSPNWNGCSIRIDLYLTLYGEKRLWKLSFTKESETQTTNYLRVEM